VVSHLRLPTRPLKAQEVAELQCPVVYEALVAQPRDVLDAVELVVALLPFGGFGRTEMDWNRQEGAPDRHRSLRIPFFWILTTRKEASRKVKVRLSHRVS